MGFWKLLKPRQKSEQREGQHRTSLHESADNAAGIREYFWIAPIVFRKNIFLRHDSILGINEQCQVAVLVLPEAIVSLARAQKVPCTGTTDSVIVDIALVQRVTSSKDESFVMPIVYPQKQNSKFQALLSSYDRGNLEKLLRKESWAKTISEIRASNPFSQFQQSLRYAVRRVKVSDNSDFTKPDDLEKVHGFGDKVPIYIYTEPTNELEFSRERLHREIIIRNMLASESLEIMKNALATNPSSASWLNDPQFANAISMAQAELLMNSELAKPYVVDLLLDSEKTELVTEPEVTIKLRPECEAEKAKIQSSKSWFSETNWGEENIVQVVLHVGESDAIKSMEDIIDSVTSPAMTVIRDELGIHTLLTHLFRVPTSVFELDIPPGELPLLDNLPASHIPEIKWQSVSERIPQVWWQTDAIAKKILWLVIRNLCSHQVGEPREVVCGVTPIGSNTIQVAISLGEREAGSPYAFAIIKDDLVIKAIPVFPSGTYESKPNGTLITKKAVFLKNYTISREGERIQNPEQLVQFIKPIYATVIGGKYNDPTVYETR